MAFTGAKFAWNGVAAHVKMPGSGETVNSEYFPVARGAKVLTVHVPALTGTGATVKLQSLAPTETVEATQVWTDVVVFDLTDGTMEALDGLVESTTVTIPVSATGGGMLRFVASESQAAATVVIEVFQSFDG
jgi:hypothetical protein